MWAVVVCFVSKLAMLASRGCVLLGFFVFTERVMMVLMRRMLR